MAAHCLLIHHLVGRSLSTSVVLLVLAVNLGPLASCLVVVLQCFSLERMTPKNILNLHFDQP